MIWIYLAVVFVTIALFLFYIRQMKINAMVIQMLSREMDVWKEQTEFNAGVVQALKGDD